MRPIFSVDFKVMVGNECRFIERIVWWWDPQPESVGNSRSFSSASFSSSWKTKKGRKEREREREREVVRVVFVLRFLFAVVAVKGRPFRWRGPFQRRVCVCVCFKAPSAIVGQIGTAEENKKKSDTKCISNYVYLKRKKRGRRKDDRPNVKGERNTRRKEQQQQQKQQQQQQQQHQRMMARIGRSGSRLYLMSRCVLIDRCDSFIYLVRGRP